MFLNFGIKTKKAFGLDISSTSVKLMELEGSEKNVQIKSFGQVLLAKGTVVNDTIMDGKSFVDSVKQLLTKPTFGKLSTQYAAVSLPESKSFVRVIQIPNMSEEEAENAVPFEAENFIPMPLEQVYLDWQKINVEGDKMNVLIIASPKDYVDNLLRLLDELKITAVALEVESQSCRRAAVSKENLETSLVVNIGMYHTNIVMIEKGSLQFTSTIPIAGGAFSDNIAKALGVSPAKAEEIKQQAGISNTVEYPNVKIATLPILKNLSSEIKNILKFHSEHSQVPVSVIWLMGGGARLKHLADFLKSEMPEYTQLKIELANPWINLPGLNDPPLKDSEALSYVTAIGLAMKGAGIGS